MKTCTLCGIVSPDGAERCACGGSLVSGDAPAQVEARVAGFWIRALADALDALVLAAVGFLLAKVFRRPLLALGERSILVGAAITFLYTGVLQSQFGKGQTLAKRLLGLRVVRLDGSYLSLDRSLVRWVIMGGVFYATAFASALGAVLPIFKGPAVAAALGGAQIALILGCGLLMPFHPLKRGMQDLLTGSIVLRRGQLPTTLLARLNNPRRDRILVMVTIAVALFATGAGLAMAGKTPAGSLPAGRVMASMEAMGIQTPGVVDTMAGRPALHQIIVTGYLPTYADGSSRVENAEERILALVRKEMPLDGVEKITIVLHKGVILGIYNSYDFTNRVEPATPGAQN